MKEVSWANVDDKGDGKQAAPIYQMAQGMANVPAELLDDTIQAAEDCPGSCIFLEVVDE